MTAILIYYLVFISLLFVVTDKLKIPQKLIEGKIIFLYRLGKCEFCVSFWVAVLTTVLINLIPGVGFGWQDLIKPFAIAGLWITLKQFSNE